MINKDPSSKTSISKGKAPIVRPKQEIGGIEMLWPGQKQVRPTATKSAFEIIDDYFEKKASIGAVAGKVGKTVLNGAKTLGRDVASDLSNPFTMLNVGLTVAPAISEAVENRRKVKEMREIRSSKAPQQPKVPQQPKTPQIN